MRKAEINLDKVTFPLSAWHFQRVCKFVSEAGHGQRALSTDLKVGLRLEFVLNYGLVIEHGLGRNLNFGLEH